MYIESKTLIKYGDFFLSLQLNEKIISHISNMELNFCGENGRVQAVVGTHTHIQTADARILPKGTAYITDLGMVGPWNSVLGVKTECILEKFTTCRPVRFDLADGPNVYSAVVVDIDDKTNKACSIERVFITEEDIK